jgi:hypothetical protein
MVNTFDDFQVMPIERSSPGKVTFSWRSKASLYAFCFYSLLTIVIVIVGIERIKFFQKTNKFDDYIYGILFVIFLIPHFWIPFVGWVRDISISTQASPHPLTYVPLHRAWRTTWRATNRTGEHFKCVTFE